MEKKMTQHKVIADDSLSAMDEISRVLGKDAVILKTQKINGKIEILGSNNIEDIASSNAKKINKKKNNFSHLFSNQNLENDNKVRKFNTIIENQNIKNDISSHNLSEVKSDNFDKNFVDIETFNTFTTKIDNQSEHFRKNSAQMGKLVDDLRLKIQNTALGGSEKARKKHIDLGKILPRERIRLLLDAGSPFLEFSPLAANDFPE